VHAECTTWFASNAMQRRLDSIARTLRGTWWLVGHRSDSMQVSGGSSGRWRCATRHTLLQHGLCILSKDRSILVVSLQFLLRNRRSTCVALTFGGTHVHYRRATQFNTAIQASAVLVPTLFCCDCCTASRAAAAEHIHKNSAVFLFSGH
jgi:hypothetical protein